MYDTIFINESRIKIFAIVEYCNNKENSLILPSIVRYIVVFSIKINDTGKCRPDALKNTIIPVNRNWSSKKILSCAKSDLIVILPLIKQTSKNQD